MNYQDKSYIDSKIRNLRCTLEKKIKNIDGGGGGETPSEAAYIPLKGTEEGTYIEGRFKIGENIGTEQTYLDLSKENINYDFTQSGEVGVFNVGKTGLHYKNILDWSDNKEIQTLTTQNRGFYMETSDLDYNQLAYISLDKRGVHIGTDNYLENPIHYSSFSISPQTGVEIRCTSEEHGLYSNRVFIPVTDAHYVQRRWVTNYVTGALPTKTSDLANDGEDGVSPYTTENHVSINYLRYDRANTVVSNRFNIHSDYGNHSGFNFDYDYPQMFYGTNYLRMTDDSFLDIRAGAGVDINAPYLSVNGEIYASAHVASSLFKFTNATTGTVTTQRTLHTDGTNVKYVGNDGISRDLAFKGSLDPVFTYTPTSNFSLSQIKTALEATGRVFNDCHIIINNGANHYTFKLDINPSYNIFTVAKTGTGSISFVGARNTLFTGSISILNGTFASMVKIEFSTTTNFVTIRNI